MDVGDVLGAVQAGRRDDENGPTDDENGPTDDEHTSMACRRGPRLYGARTRATTRRRADDDDNLDGHRPTQRRPGSNEGKNLENGRKAMVSGAATKTAGRTHGGDGRLTGTTDEGVRRRTRLAGATLAALYMHVIYNCSRVGLSVVCANMCSCAGTT